MEQIDENLIVLRCIPRHGEDFAAVIFVAYGRRSFARQILGNGIPRDGYG